MWKRTNIIYKILFAEGDDLKKTKLFFLNALILSLVNVVMRMVGVSFNAYVSVKVGEECMGLFTLVMSVYGLAVTFAASGVNLAVVKLVAETYAKIEKCGSDNPKKQLGRVVRSAVVYSLLFGCAAGAAVYFASDFIGNILLKDSRTILSLRVFSFSLPAIAVSSAVAGYFTGVRKVYKNAVISVIEQLVKIFIIMAGLVLVAPRGMEAACVAIVGGGAAAEGASLISSTVLYVFDRVKKTPAPSAGREEWKAPGFSEVASLALPVAVGAYARQGLLTAEHLAIPRGLAKYGMDTAQSLAAYGVMHGMVMPLVLFPSAVLGSFASLLIPELSECAALGDRRRICSIGEKVFRSSLLFSVCVAGIFLSFSRSIGIGMYGSEEAARQLHLIAALVPVMYLDSAVDSMLKGLGEQVYCMKVNVADSMMCLALVFVLVPKYGIDGYILLTIISEIVNASFSIFRLLKVTGMKIKYVRWLVCPFVSVFASTTLAKLLSRAVPPLGKTSVLIVICVILYAAFCFLLGAVKKEDLPLRYAGGILKKDFVPRKNSGLL